MKRFSLDSKKHASTPMTSSIKLSFDSTGVEVDLTLYRSIIGSLLYLTASRSDIAFSVGVCAHFQAAPKESHMTAAKRIIWYVDGTFDYGIWYSRDSNDCLAGYLDADWARYVNDRKSTSRGCFYLVNNLVSWMSKKQNSLCQLLKRSILQRVVFVLNYCGWRIFFMIMEFLKTLCAYFVTIRVSSIYPRIQSNTQSKSISKFNIISFETWWKRRLCAWSLSTPQIKRLTSSLNQLMVHGLNPFIRPSVSVSSLDSLFLCDPHLIINAFM